VHDPFYCPEPECAPGEPTDAAPGSERKIRILVERAARHEPLFHPLDGLRRSKESRPFWVQRLEVSPTQPEPEATAPVLCPEPEAAADTLEFEPIDDGQGQEEFAAQILDEAV
jgi:hypothetical protein